MHKKQVLNNIKAENASNNISKRHIIGRVTGTSGDGQSVSLSGAHNGTVSASNYEPYGVASGLTEGLLCAVVNLNEARSAIIGTVNSARPSTKPGETIVYSAYGQKVSLTADNKLSLTANGGEITIQDTGNILMSAHGASIEIRSDGKIYITDVDGERSL